MHAAILAAIIFGQPLDAKSEIRFRERHQEIVAELKRSLSDASKTRQELLDASTQADARLQELLDDAAEEQVTLLPSQELLAIAESAERLRKYQTAIYYAKLATQESSDLEPHIALIRSQCQSGQISDAEKTLADARKKHPDDKMTYLTHNLVALKYQALGNHEKAYHHFRHTAVHVAARTSSDTFFIGHLGRCLDHLHQEAVACGRENELESAYRDVKRSIISTNQCLAEVLNSQKNDQASSSCLKRVRLGCHALLVLDRFTGGNEADSILHKWTLFLTHITKNSGNSEWRTEAHCLLRSVPLVIASNNSPSIDALLSAELKPAIDRIAPSDDTAMLKREIDQVCARIQQYRRHMKLTGRPIITPSRTSSYCGRNEQNAAGLLLHIVDPNHTTSLQSIHLFNMEKQSFSKERIELRFLSARVLKTGTGKNQDSNRRPSDAKGLSSELTNRITMESAEKSLMDSLSPEILPVSVLVDRQGKVVTILSGSEPFIISKLINCGRELAVSPHSEVAESD